VTVRGISLIDEVVTVRGTDNKRSHVMWGKQRHNIKYARAVKVSARIQLTKKKISHRPLRGSSSAMGTLSRRGLNPIKLAYKLAR